MFTIFNVIIIYILNIGNLAKINDKKIKELFLDVIRLNKLQLPH